MVADVQDLAAVSDLTLASFFRDTTRRLDGSVLEAGDLLLFDGGDPGTRGAMRLGRARAAGADVVTRITAFFASRKPAGHSVTARSGIDGDLPEALTDAGYTAGMDLAGMVLDRSPEEAPPREGTMVHQVRDQTNASAFREIVAESFPDERDTIERIFETVAALTAPGVVAMVVYADGEPTSAAISVSHDRIAAIDWVATRPAFRGQGFAELVTRAVSRAAFEAGNRYAALQAAPDAARLYARLGYREVRRYRWYRSPAPESGSRASAHG